MPSENHTMVSEFILIGFSTFPQLQAFFFVLFLLMYLSTLLCTLLIIVTVQNERKLHTPMYLYLCSLSLSEIFYTFAIIPKMLSDLLSTQRTISFLGCANQMFFSFTFGFMHSFLLTTMGYDRYVAICHPLRYEVLMNPQICIWLVVASCLGGLVMGLVVTGAVFHLSFCGPSEIHHFACHMLPIVKLACGDVSVTALVVGMLCFIVLLSCFLLILLSYTFIVATIVKIPSAEGRLTAFSTCVSHLTVVVVHYSFASIIFFKPKAPHVLEGDTLMAVTYTVLTPFLSPIIFSLRNKELKNALKKTFKNSLFPQKNEGLEDLQRHLY
ncbi:olfactory receptor 10H1-like [Tachyglossus aculeatus]|uniref:olfactory receptor 10H1-like n=1 Tax=Tachyglossus aculeatus TaxID=9261 RepID=UPI0018F5AA78|nr:olfactory receptor 10H1-like [Tachyglossus aculeatus]